MTPTPEEPRHSSAGDRSCTMAPEYDGDSIVISGMSGLFPDSHNVKEFADILYEKINPVSSKVSRWKWTHPESSNYVGKVPDIHLFDSQFFMVHHQLAHWMDPMARKILEHSYQAIYDAGLSPKHLNGKKVGVFIAAALSESEKTGFVDIVSKSGFGISGCSKTMYANRVSYWLNAKGPSLTLDDACCGFPVALEKACSAINSGICEAAIVGGSNLCLLPHSQVHASRCVKISPNEKTMSFDANAAGCTKSEAISVIFVQKARNALRAYAEVVHIKNEFISRLSCETGQKFGFTRNPDNTATFLKNFYSEANVPAQDVEYVEAFGSADPEADKAELEAIEKVFCNGRTEPLYVGSVISNIGYTEAASGGTAITKVLLGFHNGSVASNLHCAAPRQDVAAIRDGRMCVLTEHLPFRGSLAAINCLSLTGVNSHVLLRGCTKPKDLTRYRASIPRLVTISARQDELLGNIFEDLKSRPIDPEELALLHNIHSTDISGHLGRGYIILDDVDNKQKPISLSEKMEHFDNSQRPLWFVYSGMGSQWVGMGAQLMRIPIFAAAIERCRTVLEPKGINIVEIITSSDKTTFDNILHSFVGIAAIQIGLTDILTALGLRPDKLIGHSVGELGCAYADGCLTAEEMILSAYSRGKASLETPLITGAMAAVGLGYSQLSRRCPPEIEIACHNSTESSTISGPVDKLREFVATLTAEGIFAREVPCSNIAYHSRYISDAGPHLLRRLSNIILKPRARSARWLSTSIPQERWDEPIAQYCSAEYLTNNLLSSVYFEETCRLMESNAVVVEVAPHGLLQAILRRALPPSCTNIPLAQRNHQDNVHFLLDAIGKLYIEGYTPRVQALYPRVEFPVSTGTPHLSHLVKWYHLESWSVPVLCDERVRSSCCANFTITKHDDEYSYLNGNVIQGRVLYPFAATLVSVWDTLAMAIGIPRKKLSVRFDDVVLYSQPILHDQKSLKLSISLNRGNGHFEVLGGDSIVASGHVFYVQKTNATVESKTTATSTDFAITSAELYRHFSSCGYSYKDEFRSILSVDNSLSMAQVAWNNNWVALIDGMLQLNALRHSLDGVTQPTHIRNITIDIRKHVQQIQNNKYIAKVDDLFDFTSCGGITIRGLKFRKTMPVSNNNLQLSILSNTGKPSVNGNGGWNKNDPETDNTALQIGTAGDLNSLRWEKVPKIPESGIEVMVEYAGINIADVNRATTSALRDNNKKYYGLDFSGLTKSGARVMGVAQEGSAREAVFARSELLWPVPTHWSLEDAATVPLAYLQAYYCLFIKGQLKPGARVLIHGGAGALGQAAISIALANRCQVFTTVSNRNKKKHLLQLFPELNENSIGNSRDTTFGDLVLNATNREGCDVVLSCVRGDLKHVSLKCASTYGITCDTAQIQYRDNYVFGMHYMMTPRSYILVDFNTVLESEDTQMLRKLQLLVSEGISKGEVRPLSRVSYCARDAPRAFRLLANSNHRGRVLLRVRDSIPAIQHSFVCSPNSIHIVIWDGSSLGLQFANRLVARGVRKLRLQCLKMTTDYRIKLGLWQNLDVDVEMHNGSLSNSEDVAKILKEANQCCDVEGIYVIGADSENKPSDIAKVVELLDGASRKLCPLIKYFGVITVDGNVGHDTCISRSKNGLAATALSLPVYKYSVGDCSKSSKQSHWLRSAVDSIERALASAAPIQIAKPQSTEKPSLLSLIASLTDKSKDYDSLRDLLTVDSLPLIKSCLIDTYQVSYDDEEILNLTKEKIIEIEKNATECRDDDVPVKGLDTFYSNVNLDELYVNAESIPMDTLVHEIKAMDDEIDETKTHLFVIPGVEGHYARFSTLCAHLKVPALVLQPGLDRPHDSPKDMALTYSKILLEKFKLKNNFYLLAYECGIFAALELVGILEDHGLTGTLYCLGDGPDEMKALLEEQLSEFGNEAALEEAVARHMVSLLAGGATPAGLEHCHSWAERVEVCVRACVGRVSHSMQYVRAVLSAARARITAARRYGAEVRALRSRLVLLRARRAPAAPAACSLQRYSRAPLIVEPLSAPLHGAADDLRAPAIINSYLDDDILQIYNNSNLCSTYTF